MKKALYIAAVCMALTALPTIASAQPKSGDKEVLIGGNVSTLLSAGSQMTQGQLQFGIGYFTTDRLEIGVSPLISISSQQTPGTVQFVRGQIITTEPTTTISTDAGVSTSLQYFFGGAAARVKPYMGATYVINSFKTSEGQSLADNTFTGGTVGVKNYFSEKAALDMKGSFGFRPNAPGDFQILNFNIGITYLF